MLLDAHADTWEAYYGERYFHGTPFKRALEEGLIDPHRSLLAGMRGPLYAASDLDEPRSWGFEIVPCDELRAWTPAEYGARVRERIGDGPAYLSFDIDVLDPAFAPGTGTPEIAGLLPHEAVAFLRALAGIRFTGFDVVEVSPPYDGPGQVTALTGASIAYELLALRRSPPRRADGPRTPALRPRVGRRDCARRSGIIARRGDALPLSDAHGLAVPVWARGARAAPARRAVHRRPGPVPGAEPARGGGSERPAPRPAARDRRRGDLRLETDRRAPRLHDVPFRREESVMVKVGLLARFDAVPGKEEDVAQFLEGALALANEEEQTTVWFALRLGPSTFGVFDAFADESGRQAHLNGKIAEALLGSVGELVQQPSIEQVDVLAAKVPG